MVVRRSRATALAGVVAALFLMAGVAAAAGAGFNAMSSIGAGNKAVTSPCSSVTATMVPAYDTDGFYKVGSVEVALTCAAGDYSVRITLGTGGSSYVERTTSASFLAQGSQTAVVTFPTAVKVSDVVNIAALVLPAGS